MAMVFFFVIETSKLWSCSSWFFPKLPKFPKLCSSYSWFFSKIPRLWSSSSWPKPWSHGLLFHSFFQSSKSHLFILGSTLKAMVFFFLDFSKIPKVVVFFLVFPKVRWPWSSCELLVISQLAHCLIQLLDYLQIWNFQALPPYPAMFFVLIIKSKEGGEGGVVEGDGDGWESFGLGGEGEGQG